jgi:hypothetical protein
MSTEAPEAADFKLWTATQLATYMRDTGGLGAYYEALLANDITGATAPQLTEPDLKEMGITSIGDRKRFLSTIDELKKQHRKHEREKILWEDEQILFFS